MLKEPQSNAKPTKYAQNKRHSMYEGTLSMMNLAPERCTAPNTAKGMAKHKLLKATILSRPPARAISVLAAHSATRKSTMPALHIETTGREISKNVARMVVCMWMPGLNSRPLSVLHLGRNLLLGFKNGQKYTPTLTAFFGIKTRPASGRLENRNSKLENSKKKIPPFPPRVIRDAECEHKPDPNR